jgi:hypothetical protein
MRIPKEYDPLFRCRGPIGNWIVFTPGCKLIWLFFKFAEFHSAIITPSKE